MKIGKVGSIDIDFIGLGRGFSRFSAKYDNMIDIWDYCPRVDWLCWFLEKLNSPIDEKSMRLLAVWLTKSTPLPDGRTTEALLIEQNSIDALVAAEKFATGEITSESLLEIWLRSMEAMHSIRDPEVISVANAATLSASGCISWDTIRSVARNAAWPSLRTAEEQHVLSAQAFELKRRVKNPFLKDTKI